MEVPLIVKNNEYSLETTVCWQLAWSLICDMCYHKKNIQESILITPERFVIEGEQKENSTPKEHSDYYAKKIPTNDEEITLDYVWKQYSKQNHEIYIIPEFKKLYVPKCLFHDIGVRSWFRHCFPNCTITYWED